jgi:DNA-binding transcriptional ArsR family regulator
MGARRRKESVADAANLFSALGDTTRLMLVQRLVDASPLTATELGEGAAVTRQAVAKHLKVLEEAGVLSAEKRGRERLYSLERARIEHAQHVLDGISAGWDRALERLRRQVES